MGMGMGMGIFYSIAGLHIKLSQLGNPSDLANQRECLPIFAKEIEAPINAYKRSVSTFSRSKRDCRAETQRMGMEMGIFYSIAGLQIKLSQLSNPSDLVNQRECLPIFAMEIEAPINAYKRSVSTFSRSKRDCRAETQRMGMEMGILYSIAGLILCVSARQSLAVPAKCLPIF